AERDAHSDDDEGYRRRQDDPAKQRESLRAETARGVDQGRVDGASAGLGVEVEREEFGDHDHEDDGGVAQPEPENGERNPGNSRNRIKRPDHGIDELARGARAAEEEAERYREKRRNREARDRTREARRKLLIDVRTVEPRLLVVQRQGVENGPRD